MIGCNHLHHLSGQHGAFIVYLQLLDKVWSSLWYDDDAFVGSLVECQNQYLINSQSQRHSVQLESTSCSSYIQNSHFPSSRCCGSRSRLPSGNRPHLRALLDPTRAHQEPSRYVAAPVSLPHQPAARCPRTPAAGAAAAWLQHPLCLQHPALRECQSANQELRSAGRLRHALHPHHR